MYLLQSQYTWKGLCARTSSRAGFEEDLKVRGPFSNRTVPPPTLTLWELSHPPRRFEPSIRVILVAGCFLARW